MLLRAMIRCKDGKLRSHRGVVESRRVGGRM